MEKRILVTGASGFIGSFLVEGGLERGMQVWAGVRKSSSRKYLKDSRTGFCSSRKAGGTIDGSQTNAWRMGLYHSLCGCD